MVSLGYKIHSRPIGPDKPGAEPKDLRKLSVSGDIRTMHTRKGWHSIMWAGWDEMGGENQGRKFQRIEQWSIDWYSEGIQDVFEVLFGPYPELQPYSDDRAKEQYTVSKRKAMVRTVRILLAAVGMDYRVATEDGEEDVPPDSYSGKGEISYHLENSDKWFARETRAACGFQLQRDPEEKRKGEAEQEELRREFDDSEEDEDEDEDEDGDGMSDGEYSW